MRTATTPGLVDTSKSAASLASAYVMKDGYYVSFKPASRLESEISLPDANMAVGRIVEFPADIQNVLQDFIDNNGVAHPTSALVTSYTFFTDLAQFEVNQLSSAGMNTDSLISDTWTDSDLRGKLFGTATPGIVAINLACAIQSGGCRGLCYEPSDDDFYQRDRWTTYDGHALQEHPRHFHRLPTLFPIRRHRRNL